MAPIDMTLILIHYNANPCLIRIRTILVVTKVVKYHLETKKYKYLYRYEYKKYQQSVDKISVVSLLHSPKKIKVESENRTWHTKTRNPEFQT